ncbi:MAG: hypothetical protein RR382_09845 [Tannerellaceae bacterium]
MERTNLYHYIENPSLLNEETLVELKCLVEEFPFFSAVRMLYLKNLAILNDMRFATELKRMAVYVSDRKKLFMLIEGEQYGLKMQEIQKDKTSEVDTFSLIDAFLSSREDETAQRPATSLLFQPSASSDYIFWSLAKEEEGALSGTESSVRLQHHDLIDSFIQNEEHRASGTGLGAEVANEPIKPPLSVKEMTDMHSKSLDDSYFTETLAHIYIKQRRYEKALQIIKNLSLKYPKKNVYFADQIRFLEKLIINTKK